MEFTMPVYHRIHLLSHYVSTTNRFMFALLITSEMHIETIVKYQFTPLREATAKKKDSKCWQNVEEGSPVHHGQWSKLKRACWEFEQSSFKEEKQNHTNDYFLDGYRSRAHRPRDPLWPSCGSTRSIHPQKSGWQISEASVHEEIIQALKKRKPCHLQHHEKG